MNRPRAATTGPSTAGNRGPALSIETKRNHGKPGHFKRRRAQGRSRQVDSEERLRHRAFPQPRRTSRPVWHYMTLAKFIALLDTRALFFCRLDRLGDDYEGRLPRRWRGELPPAKEAAQTRRLRASCYVNCWNMSDDENEALWRLYGAQEASVAIRTTYAELVHVLEQTAGVYLGLISYVDCPFEERRMTSDLAHVMHKRRAFKHEEEVRFVKVLGGVRPQSARPDGLDVPVDLNRLVRGIYIDPYAPEWFEKIVRAVVSKFAPTLSNRVTWSSIKADPLS